MLNQVFKLRRDKLLKTLDHSSVVVIFSNPSNDYYHADQVDPEFYYLTGISETEAVAILIPKTKKFILFSHPNNRHNTIWHGNYIGQKDAVRVFGVHQAYPLAAADQLIPKILAHYPKIYLNSIAATQFKTKLTNWTDPLTHDFLSVSSILDEFRLIKDQTEITAMQKAAAISAKGFLRVMQKTRPGLYEYELKAELLHEFIRLGNHPVAFEPIVAGGKRACTLHYVQNNQKLKAGELVLVDAGAKYNYYSADVARTFPVNGKFTNNQRCLYELVLLAQQEVIKQVAPGVSWNQLQATAEEVITEGLVELGMLKGKVRNLLDKRSCRKFFMHKIGHWIGLNTHDVGSYYHHQRWRKLEPGMIFTVEPGIYIAPNISNFKPKWDTIGIRIEDMILVTETGCLNLTSAIPKKVTEIEKLMKLTFLE